MASKRYNAASVIKSETFLWVSGGNSGSGTLSSSEYINMDSEFINMDINTIGPELPIALESHTMIVITDDLTLVIGGSSVGIEKSETFYFHHDKSQEQWSAGPKLQNGREKHAVGVVTDRITLKKLVVVTGGLFKGVTLKSSEILLDNVWFNGEIISLSHYTEAYFFKVQKSQRYLWRH